MNLLLDYFFSITAINPTPAASTASLKQVCVVGKPKDGGVSTGVVTLCTTKAAVSAFFGAAAKAECDELFNAGMSRIYVLPMDDLNLADALEPEQSKFFTVLITSDFDEEDMETILEVVEVKSSRKIQDILYTSKLTGDAGDAITIIYTDGASDGEANVSVSTNAITVQIEDGVTTAATIAAAIAAYPAAHALVGTAVDAGDETDPQSDFSPALALQGGVDEVEAEESSFSLGTFKGVTGVSSTDDEFLEDQSAIERRSPFKTTSGVKAKNMFFAFGKLLSNSLDWKNQQYIQVPFASDITVLGAAKNLRDLRINFVITDAQYGDRLAFFAAGKKAIVAPYILRNLEIDLQSKGLQYVSANQPQYTFTQAALIEDELQKVIDGDGQPNGNPGYVGRGWITEGKVDIRLEQDDFIASGYIEVPTPRALWAIDGQITTR